MPVVTELVIDSAKAVAGAADYSRAMDAASSAAQRGLGAISDVATKAKDSLSNLGAAAASITPSITTMAVGVTAASAAFLAGFEAVKKMASGLAEMGLAAKRANLDIEAFQKFQFATGAGGLSSKDFGSGTEKLASNLSEALRSENDMSKLLDANNVKWKDGNKLVLDTNGLLNVARDLIHRAADEQQKIKMAEMLGLTKDWVPALDKSAQAFAGLQEEASALGLVISRDTVEKAKQFDDEWRKSSLVFSTWMKARLADLLPLLDQLISKAGEFKQGVMDSLDAAASSPAGQEFTLRSNRAAAIMEMASVENTAKDNADLLASAAKALAGTLSETTARLLDQQIAAKGVAKFWTDVAASMDGAAAAGEKLTKSLPSGANDNKAKPSVLPDKDEATAAKDALDRSIESVKRHTALTIADTQAQGLGTAALAEFRVQAELVEAAGRADIEVTQKWRDKFDDLAADAGDAALALEKVRVATQIGRDRQTAFLSSEDVQIANQLKGIYPDIATALGSSEAAAMRFNNALKEGHDTAIRFAQSFVSGLMDGKSLTDALSSSLKNLSKELAGNAIKSLLNGDFEKAAIQGISAIATYIGSVLTGNSAEKLKQQIALIDKVNALQARNIAATVDQSTLGGQLASFDTQANLQRIQEARDGGAAMAALELTLSLERAKIITDFNTKAVADDQAAAAARIAAQDEINKRQQSFQDRLLQATTDQTTLEGQLAILDRQQQREREAEVATGGQALVDLEAAQAAERFNTIKGYNDKIVEDSKKTAQEQLDAQTKAARSIVDYINGINVGSDSALSPQQRLSAAQSTYNSILSLAQGGNADALGRITQDAENLRKALQGVFASGGGFQTGWAQIQAQLLSLPAVATSSDPVVAAIRDNITATQQVKVAVQADTSALVSNFDTAINKFSEAVTYLAQAVDKLVTSNSLLDAIRALNDTSKQQLTLLAGQLTSASATTFSPQTSTPVAISRNMLDALRAIVVNTYAISSNTARSVDFQRNGIGNPGFIGTLAGGGWITGGIPNKDSVLLGSRTAIGMPGEFVVSKDVAQANRASLTMFNETGQWPVPGLSSSFVGSSIPSFGAANDNGMVAEMRRGNAALMQLLSAIGAALVNAETQTGAEVKNAIVGALKEHTEVVKAEGRQARNNPKAA